MGDVEEEDRAQGILLGLRGQHPLGDVAAAARLGAGIPDGPPLNRDGHDEDGHSDVPVILEVGQHAEEIDAVGAGFRGEGRDEDVHPADVLDGEVGGGDDGRHLDEELDHIDDQDAPEAGDRGEDDVETANEEKGLPPGQSEQDGGDLAGGQVDRGHDHAVEEEAQVDRPEAADEGRRLPRVADLVEFEVRHDLRASPHPGVKEDRRDARQGEGPPDPVPGDAVAPDDVGDQVGGVAREGRSDHRQPGQPPRNGPAGNEELRGALTRPLPIEKGGDEADG